MFLVFVYRLWWTDMLDKGRFFFIPPTAAISLNVTIEYMCHYDNMIFQVCFRCALNYDDNTIRNLALFLSRLRRSHSNRPICSETKNNGSCAIPPSKWDCGIRDWIKEKKNLLTSDALVATELMLGDNADSGLAFKPYGYRAWKYDGCCCCCCCWFCWFDSDGRYGGKLMLDSTLAVVEPLLLLQSPIDEDEPAIIFVEDVEIAFRCQINWKGIRSLASFCQN